jgi:methyl-accepting chemotaxis protein
MGRLFTRIAGLALIVAGLAGLLLAVAGLFVLVQVEKNILSAAQEQVQMLDHALSATMEGLDVAETSLLQAVATVKTLERTVGGVGDTVGSSVPAVDSISTLVGVQLPTTIESTQETLTSAAASAKTVDDLLTVLSTIPLLGVEPYNPDVPLNEGFLNVAVSLDGIPDSLVATQKQLIITNGNLEGLEDSFDTMAGDIGQVANSIGNAQSVLQQYKGVIGQLQGSVSWVSSALPSWVQWLRLGLSLLLVWLGIAQLALITQGWELIGRSRRARPVETQVPAPAPQA